jgi:hypothetical protein
MIAESRITPAMAARQAAMNEPLTRAAACAIVAVLLDPTSENKNERLREWADKCPDFPLALDLAGLLMLKPRAPWGAEVWS